MLDAPALQDDFYLNLVDWSASNVLAVVFQVLSSLGVQVEMLSQGASKVKISLVVPGEREQEVIQALHACFFEDSCLVPMQQQSPGVPSGTVG